VDRHFVKIPSKEEERDISTVTVSVTPDEGRLLASTGREGKIHWFLRNPDEPPARPLIHAQKPKAMAETVEIWKAGIQELNSSPLHSESL
jgi:hypothetical protein